MGDSAKKKIAVIDGNSWLHRAYHAVPPTVKLMDGTPTNAVHGFLNMFSSFVSKADPDAVICAFDAGIPAFRLEAVSQYKAHRKPMDPELRVQFPIIEEVLQAMKIPVVKVDGWEGDDILGTIAKNAEDAGMQALLVTGDKDANQLATDNIHIVNMKKGVSDVAILDPDAVLEKYGVRVDQFIDYLALMGDSSDNIPGVPGIGPKSATTLLQKFGSIDGIYANLDQLKGKQKENIKNNKDAAYVSQTAATIATDVPLNLDLDVVIFPSYDKEDILPTFSKYHLKSGLKMALGFIGDDIDEDLQMEGFSHKAAASRHESSVDSLTESAEVFVPARTNVLKITEDVLAEDEEAVDIADKWLNESTNISVAIGNTIKVQVQSSIFDLDSDQDSCDGSDSTLLVAVTEGKTVAILNGSNALGFLTKVATSKSPQNIIVEDGKQLLREVFPANSDTSASINIKQLMDSEYFDIGLAGYVLDSNKSDYRSVDIYSQIYGEVLDDPACVIDEQKHFGGKRVDKNSQDYAQVKNNNTRLRVAHRAAVAFALQDPICQLLEHNGCMNVYKEIERPLTSVLVLMERNGCKIDLEQMHKLNIEMTSAIDVLTDEIYEMAGHEFNIDSPKQLGVILFEEKQLPAKKKTKTGYSTNAEVLEELAQIDPLPAAVLKYRELAKIRSTYVVALPELVQSDNRIHTTFHQRKTTTGRLSSSDPNIQNIPTRSEVGNKIRECFIPLDPDHKMVCADYSQIELRLLAHLSQDQGLIDAFNSGRDFHAATASSIFGVNLDDVSKQQRSAAKAVNFGIIYGQQAYGLSQSLQIEMSEAKEIIDRYFVTYPRVAEYLDEIVEDATKLGYAKTMFGRRRYIPELSGNSRLLAFGKRTAMNHPMQGSAADIIKIAMRKCQKRICDEKLSAICMMQVHDELDFSCPENEVSKLTKIVKCEMENAAELSVPLVVDVSVGNTWAQAK